MDRYEVFYRDRLIGLLTVVPKTGMHCYEPDEAGAAAAGQLTPLSHELLHGTSGFVPPIPFFQTRLKHMDRFGLREINYQTDYFTVRKLD